MDWAHACMIAEKKNLFTTKDVIDGLKQKLARRKPYLAENRTVDKQEARSIWREVKKEEKAKKAP